MSGSTLNFTDDREVDIHQYAASATLGQTRPSRWSWRVSLGAVIGGALTHDGRRHDIGPGVVGSVGGSRQWVRDDWFVTGSLGFAASRATTREDVDGAPRVSLVATDLRAGVVAGRTFGPVSPYLMARGFAGPVSWELDQMDVGGSDTHFFQAGAGVSVSTARGLALVLDVSALGERAASLGMTARL